MKWPVPRTKPCNADLIAKRAVPGIEPGTSRTLSENHTTTPNSQLPMKNPCHIPGSPIIATTACHVVLGRPAVSRWKYTHRWPEPTTTSPRAVQPVVWVRRAVLISHALAIAGPHVLLLILRYTVPSRCSVVCFVSNHRVNDESKRTMGLA